MRSVTGREQGMAPLTRPAAEAFLYREARFLDEGRFDEWLALFTEDAHYWVPCAEGADPQLTTHLVYDDHRQLEDRVWQLRHPRRVSQGPPSLTTRLISNVEVENVASSEALVRSSFALHEVRRVQGGRGDQRTFAGRCQHLLRYEAGELRIVCKTVWLVNRDLPISNLTFLL